MTITLMVAYEYPHKLILAPALIIILAATITLIVKHPSSKRTVGGFLILVGGGEALGTLNIMFLGGFLIGLATLIIGVIIFAFTFPSLAKERFNRLKIGTLRKSIFAVLAIVIAVSALVLSIRATTNLLREQHLENYPGSSSPNLALRGVITGISLNYEVNTGYSYHIFPACITLNVTEFVWGSNMWENQTSAADYWLNHQGSTVIYYEKTDVSKLAVGQQAEFKGYHCPWIEDSLYSNMLVVEPSINDSYINP
jgi:hypothetical protein